MALFSNITDFKKYVGGGANVSLQMASIEPIMHDVVRDHISPYIGYAYISALTGGDIALAAANDPFWDMVKRPIALLTLHEYAKIGAVQLSELGIVRATTDTHQSAFQYQENDYKNYMLTKGYEALEELLLFLQKNATYTVSTEFPQGKYAWWLDSEGFARHNELFVQTAAQMRTIYGADITRYSYEILRGLLRDVEYYAIQAALPKRFFDRLKAARYDTNATAYEIHLLNLIRSAIVHFVVEEGLRRFWVKIEGRSIVHLEKKGNQSSVTQTVGSNEAVKLKIQHHEVWAVRHISRLRAYVWDNKAHFPSCFATTEGGSNADTDAWKTAVSNTNTTLQKTRTVFTF